MWREGHHLGSPHPSTGALLALRRLGLGAGPMRVMVTPWVREAMGDLEWGQVAAMRGECNGTLRLFASSPVGPFTARLTIEGYDEIRHDAGSLYLLLTRVLASVEALA